MKKKYIIMLYKKYLFFLILFIFNKVECRKDVKIEDNSNNYLFSKIKIDNKDYNFLIDTTSSYTFLFKRNIETYDFNLIIGNQKIFYNNVLSCEFGTKNMYVDDIFVSNQTLGLCSDILNAPFDGILGLGTFNNYSQFSLDVNNVTLYFDTIFNNILKQKNMNKKVFTLWIDKLYGNHIKTKGMLTFGTIDKSKYTGNIYWVNTMKNKDNLIRWVFNIDNVIYNTKKFNEKYITYISSGYSDILVPTNTYMEINNSINNNYTIEKNGRYCYDNINDKYSSIIFKTGNINLTMEIKDYIYIEKLSKKYCSRILESNDNKTITLGIPFLQTYFSTFNIKTHSIGFAKSISN